MKTVALLVLIAASVACAQTAASRNLRLMPRKSQPLSRQVQSLSRTTRACSTGPLRRVASTGFCALAPMAGPVFRVFLEQYILSPAVLTKFF